MAKIINKTILQMFMDGCDKDRATSARLHMIDSTIDEISCIVEEENGFPERKNALRDVIAKMIEIASDPEDDAPVRARAMQGVVTLMKNATLCINDSINHTLDREFQNAACAKRLNWIVNFPDFQSTLESLIGIAEDGGEPRVRQAALSAYIAMNNVLSESSLKYKVGEEMDSRAETLKAIFPTALWEAGPRPMQKAKKTEPKLDLDF